MGTGGQLGALEHRTHSLFKVRGMIDKWDVCWSPGGLSFTDVYDCVI